MLTYPVPNKLLIQQQTTTFPDCMDECPITCFEQSATQQQNVFRRIYRRISTSISLHPSLPRHTTRRVYIKFVRKIEQAKGQRFCWQKLGTAPKDTRNCRQTVCIGCYVFPNPSLQSRNEDSGPMFSRISYLMLALQSYLES